jgi:hypothetical protein
MKWFRWNENNDPICSRFLRRQTTLIRLHGWRSNPSVRSPQAKVPQTGSPVRYGSTRSFRHLTRLLSLVPALHSSPERVPRGTPIPRTDINCYGRLRMGSAGRWSDRRNSPRTCGLVRAGREALARSYTDHGYDPYRHSGTIRWQGCGLDGTR